MTDWLLPFREQEAGVVIPVRALAGSRRNEVIGIHEGRLKIAVTQVAEKGKANVELARVLAKAIGIKLRQVELISGPTSPQKEFLITGIPIAELNARLLIALG